MSMAATTCWASRRPKTSDTCAPRIPCGCLRREYLESSKPKGLPCICCFENTPGVSGAARDARGQRPLNFTPADS